MRRSDGAESGSTDIMKPLKASPIKVRRQFDATFKREAVANWLTSGKSAEVVALELGLSANRLYAWRNLLDPAAAGGGGRRPGPGKARSPICSPNWRPLGARTATCASNAIF